MAWKDKAQQHLETKKPKSKLLSVSMRVLIADLKDYETKWSQWEQGFIASIEERLDDAKFITDDQCDKLQELWERHVR